MKNREVVFIVIGYNRRDDQGNFHDSCQIEVYAKNEQEAETRAKSYIKKEFYHIKQIIEK